MDFQRSWKSYHGVVLIRFDIICILIILFPVSPARAVSSSRRPLSGSARRPSSPELSALVPSRVLPSALVRISAAAVVQRAAVVSGAAALVRISAAAVVSGAAGPRRLACWPSSPRACWPSSPGLLAVVRISAAAVVSGAAGRRRLACWPSSSGVLPSVVLVVPVGAALPCWPSSSVLAVVVLACPRPDRREGRRPGK